MKEAFFKLGEEKQQRILEAAMKEFGEKDYSSASLNRIIAGAGISKGGMFKYIDGKEDLYLYVVEGVLNEMVAEKESRSFSSDCYIDRILEDLKSGFDYYEVHQKGYLVVSRALTDYESPCFEQLMTLRESLVENDRRRLLDGVNWKQYCASEEDVVKVVSYVLEGFQNRLRRQMADKQLVTKLRHEAIADLDTVMTVMKKGLLKDVKA